MGLALPALSYLAREHKKYPFGEKVLILGRQYVFATFDEVLELLKLEDIKPARLDSDFDTTTNIPKWKTNSDKKSIQAMSRFLHCWAQNCTQWISLIMKVQTLSKI